MPGENSPSSSPSLMGSYPWRRARFATSPADAASPAESRLALHCGVVRSRPRSARGMGNPRRSEWRRRNTNANRGSAPVADAEMAYPKQFPSVAADPCGHPQNPCFANSGSRAMMRLLAALPSMVSRPRKSLQDCGPRHVAPYKAGESSPNIARRTILIGGPPWRRKSSWKRSRLKAEPSRAATSARNF